MRGRRPELLPVLEGRGRATNRFRSLRQAVFLLVLLPFAHRFLVLAVNQVAVDVERGEMLLCARRADNDRQWDAASQ